MQARPRVVMDTAFDVEAGRAGQTRSRPQSGGPAQSLLAVLPCSHCRTMGPGDQARSTERGEAVPATAATGEVWMHPGSWALGGSNGAGLFSMAVMGPDPAMAGRSSLYSARFGARQRRGSRYEVWAEPSRDPDELPVVSIT